MVGQYMGMNPDEIDIGAARAEIERAPPHRVDDRFLVDRHHQRLAHLLVGEVLVVVVQRHHHRPDIHPALALQVRRRRRDESNPWNTPNYDNPELAALTEQARVTVDAGERDAILKQMALMVMDDVAYIPIGASGRLVYWWPWVKNFYGEAMSGGTSVGPYLEHLWIDQTLKAEMGH